MPGPSAARTAEFNKVSCTINLLLHRPPFLPCPSLVMAAPCFKVHSPSKGGQMKSCAQKQSAGIKGFQRILDGDHSVLRPAEPYILETSYRLCPLVGRPLQFPYSSMQSCAGFSMHRWTEAHLKVCGRAKILGFPPTNFRLASSSASSNVALVFSPMLRARPGSSAPTM